MIGREPPLDFFRKAGVPIRGEWRAKQYVTFGLFLLFCLWMYHWKKGDWIFGGENPIHHYWAKKGWFPQGVVGWFGSIGHDPSSFLYTLKHSMLSPSFYYTLAYCTCVTVFGIKRIKRRRTPYVKQQTMLLIAIQCVPLFILPELLLPYLGRNGFFDEGTRTAKVMHRLLAGATAQPSFLIVNRSNAEDVCPHLQQLSSKALAARLGRESTLTSDTEVGATRQNLIVPLSSELISATSSKSNRPSGDINIPVYSEYSNRRVQCHSDA